MFSDFQNFFQNSEKYSEIEKLKQIQMVFGDYTKYEIFSLEGENKIIFLVEKNSKNLKNSDSISEDDMKENEKILTKKVIREKGILTYILIFKTKFIQRNL